MIRWWRRFDGEVWWIDYVEKNLAPELEHDLRVLLHHSALDRKIVANYRKLRRVMKMLDPVQMPAQGNYYEQLHDKIMSSIESEIACDEAAEEGMLRETNLSR